MGRGRPGNGRGHESTSQTQGRWEAGEGSHGAHAPGELAERVLRIDGRPYGAYRDLAGRYVLAPGLELHVVHVQPDPYAPPSRVRIIARAPFCELPTCWAADAQASLGASDALLRALYARLEASGERALALMPLGAEVRLRTALEVHRDAQGHAVVTVRLGIRLPAAQGRRVDGRTALRILTQRLPTALTATLALPGRPDRVVEASIAAVRRHAAVQAQLDALGLVAFLADGSILPRRSGRDTRPLAARDAVPFAAPPSLAREIDLPGGERVRGLGIPKGITVVVGGGYHGKSTLLQALVRGIHPHPPGDGREGVVTERSAVWVESEDGRSVREADLGWFLDPAALPGPLTPRAFSTTNASGSTSQAAAVLEALEAGSRLLLMDEDTSAANFLARDDRMRALVPPSDEPIRPLMEQADWLRRAGVSVVLAAGSAGAVLAHADTVIQMRRYLPVDVTERARALTGHAPPTGTPSGEEANEFALRGFRVRRLGPWTWQGLTAPRGVRVRGGTDVELRGEAGHAASGGADEPGWALADARRREGRVDTERIGTLLEPGEVAAVAALIRRWAAEGVDAPVPEILRRLAARLEREGLAALGGELWDATLPRAAEVWFTLARWPRLVVRTEDGGDA